jgi:hypothetical protein
MRLSKWWLRLERRTTGPTADMGGLRTHLVTVGPGQYHAMSWDDEHYPQGVFRTLYVFSRVGLIWGPGDGALEGIPDGARSRVWWTRDGSQAFALVLAPAENTEGTT